MEGLIFFALLLGIGYFFGTRTEKQHFRALRQREQAVRGLGISATGAKATGVEADQGQLFVGSVVIASDFFKTFVAGLINLVGGRITLYERLLERGRREAILRMEESALAWGANQVINVRIQTAELSGNSGKGTVAVEVIAYGTGIR
jgi:uncharacterized protein YbjQ (UPF0145 family)